MLNLQTAQHAIAQHAVAPHTTITAQQVANLLNNVSTTFAQITYVTKVATAAAHKAVNITKVTTANVQLFSNINAATSVYANAVKRSAAKIATNSAEAVANFTAQQNYFTHTACYSVVKHNTNNNLYLYCIYNNASSLYFINNVLATKQQVAQYLTASAAAKLLNNTATVHNVTNNVTHNVVVRTIQLSNIVTINAMQQQLVAA
jgi:hypothetical protein